MSKEMDSSDARKLGRAVSPEIAKGGNRDRRRSKSSSSAGSSSWMQNSGIALDVSRLALSNAQDYLAQGRVLYRHGWNGRASALALIGMEEVSKSVWLLLIAMGAIPANKEASKPFLRDHGKKQRLANAYAAVPSWAIPPALEAMLREVVSQWQSIAAVGTQSGDDRPLTSEHAQKLQVAITAAIDNNEAELMREATPLIHELIGPKTGTDQSLKHEGLYVDYDEEGGSIRSPQRVTPAAAKRSLARLRRALSVAKPMVNDPEITEANIGQVQDMIRVFASLGELKH